MQKTNVQGDFGREGLNSQTLLDEAVLVVCMVYADLNPIRAGTAKTLESSDHTNIKKCIQSILNLEQPDHKYPATEEQAIHSLFYYANPTPRNTLQGAQLIFSGLTQV